MWQLLGAHMPELCTCGLPHLLEMLLPWTGTADAPTAPAESAGPPHPVSSPACTMGAFMPARRLPLPCLTHNAFPYLLLPKAPRKPTG